MGKIISAANYYNDNKLHEEQPKNIKEGFVITGRRHRNCDYIYQLLTRGYPEQDKEILDGRLVKGFITTDNLFVTRQEAYAIAFKYQQIIGPNAKYPTNDIGLTSEDLY